jgi:RimJ/RimL family protein N-acetyltransferase
MAETGGVGVTVRPATLDDLEAMMAQRRAIAGEGRWIGAELPLDEERDRASFTSGIEEGRSMVAEVDGELVGLIGLHPTGYGVVDLGMQVADGHRGQGIGSALLEAGIAWARAQGAHKMSLQHWPHNEVARALYEKYGFVQEGYLRRQYPRKNGEIWDAVVMGLLLDP